MHVLPWKKPDIPGYEGLKAEEVIPWLQVCARDATVEELQRQIALKFEKVHPRKG